MGRKAGYELPGKSKAVPPASPTGPSDTGVNRAFIPVAARYRLKSGWLLPGREQERPDIRSDAESSDIRNPRTRGLLATDDQKHAHRDRQLTVLGTSNVVSVPSVIR